MRTLKFKAQPTNAFFAIVNQTFGGSSQLPTTAERAVINSLSTVQTTKQYSAVVGSWEEPPNILLTAAKNAFVGCVLTELLFCSRISGRYIEVTVLKREVVTRTPTSSPIQKRKGKSKQINFPYYLFEDINKGTRKR